jgi:hypothetical protein
MRSQHLKPRRESGIVISLRQQGIGSPPFPFPPPGASGGHRRLRCATARARRRPKAERFPRSGPVRKRAWVGRGSRPGPRVLNFYDPNKPDKSLAQKSGQLDVLRSERERSTLNG